MLLDLLAAITHQLVDVLTTVQRLASHGCRPPIQASNFNFLRSIWANLGNEDYGLTWIVFEYGISIAFSLIFLRKVFRIYRYWGLLSWLSVCSVKKFFKKCWHWKILSSCSFCCHAIGGISRRPLGISTEEFGKYMTMVNMHLIVFIIVQQSLFLT